MGQKTVNTKLAFGIEGEFYDSSIKRATNYKLGASAKFGKPLFFSADGKTVTPTYAEGLRFAGIMVNPKEHINANADLAATLELASGKIVGVADIGRVIVKVANTVAVGNKAYLCTTAGTGTGTGVTNYSIGDICGGTAAPATAAGDGGVFVELTNAMFDIVEATAGQLAVLDLNK